MKPSLEISEAIERELLSWPDVTVGEHRFGGREFRVGKQEIGHLHGSHVADLPFPRAIRDEFVSSGKVSPHHHLPDSGWISFYVRIEEYVPFALALFRRNYERIHTILQRQQSNTSRSPKQSTQTAYENNHRNQSNQSNQLRSRSRNQRTKKSAPANHEFAGCRLQRARPHTTSAPQSAHPSRRLRAPAAHA
jgi:hypothetical protein